MKRLSLFMILGSIFFLQIISPALAQQPLTGEWEGFIDVQGTELVIITQFFPKANKIKGTIDIPQQGGQNIPLQNISITEADSVMFEFMAGMGMAKFKGAVEGDTTISGTFHQSGQQFPFQLTKVRKTGSKTPKDASLPYDEKELLIKNDSISIGGMLTLPKNQSTDKLVIIISGSGAQNRDGKIPVTDFEPYATLAGSLSTNGIAAFRYDDRGVGQSTGSFSNATLSTLASDVEAIINHFRNNTSQSHSFSEIILLGHSQGGIVAGKVATRYAEIDKIILMASTGVPLQEVLRFQMRKQFERIGIDRALIEKELNARGRLAEAIVRDKDTDRLKEEYREVFRTVQLAAGADSATASQLTEQQLNRFPRIFGNPQMRSLFFYDPAKDLEKINVPVLVLFGGKDTQVTVEMNKPPIEKALKSAGVSYQTKVFDNANHLFQKAKTGSSREYGDLKSTFVDDLIPSITDRIINDR